MKASYIKNTLLETINSMQNDPSSFVKSPGVDFTRHRKCSFSEIFLFLLSLETHSLTRELRRFFPKPASAPSKSALCQQRAKLNSNALPFLFHTLNRLFEFKKTFLGYHLLACDGSDVNIPPLKGDSDTAISSNTSGSAYHQIHLNAVYDLLEERYTDILIQPRAQINERTALISFIHNTSFPEKTIFICDRGYFSFNTLAHLQTSGYAFLLRLNSQEAQNSFLKRFSLPDTPEFDVSLDFNVTRSRKKRFLDDPANFICLHTKRPFDFIPISDKENLFHFSVRLVKISLSSGPEYLLTNLPKKPFNISRLKHLYHLRWGIETSFRFLKHNISLNHFHSIRRDFIFQETYARVILYNLTMLLIHGVRLPRSVRIKGYKISVSDAIVTCREFLHKSLGDHEVRAYLIRYLTKVWPDRSYPRKVRTQHYVPFANRS